MTAEHAKGMREVALATHVEPINAAGRWTLLILVVVLLIMAIFVGVGVAVHLDTSLLIAIVVVVGGAIGGPVAFNASKRMPLTK